MKTTVIQASNEHGDIESSFYYLMKRNIPITHSILDVGCSYGSLIYNLHKMGYQHVYGIDIKEEFIKTGQNSYKEISSNIMLYDGKQIPFPDEYFDAVFMFDVIEHIPDVQCFLRAEIHRVLKIGGLFVFQTPNKFINVIWQIINQRSFVKWKTSDHCSLQTPESMRNLLVAAGFRSPIIETNNFLSDHKKEKVSRKLWLIGLLFLIMLKNMPVSITTNLWGYSRKDG